MKFLNKKVNDCVQHIILQKFTNFHAIRSWSFHNICNEIGWPSFLCHPVHPNIGLHVKTSLLCSIQTRVNLYIEIYIRGKKSIN